MRLIAFCVFSFVIACGGSRKQPAQPRLDDTSKADSRERTRGEQKSKGDMTVTASTGDDLSWLAPVYFAFDSTELSPATRDTLARLHDWLAAHPKVTVTIEGHCDEHGTAEYNIGLGQRRSQIMTDYLVRLGTRPKQVTPISYGSERPAVEGHDEVAWSKNRRGEFRVGP